MKSVVLLHVFTCNLYFHTSYVENLTLYGFIEAFEENGKWSEIIVNYRDVGALPLHYCAVAWRDRDAERIRRKKQ